MFRTILFEKKTFLKGHVSKIIFYVQQWLILILRKVHQQIILHF